MSRAPGGRLRAALYGLRMGFALSATGLYAFLAVILLLIAVNAPRDVSAWWPVLLGLVALEGGVAAVAYAVAVVRPAVVPHRWPGYVGMWVAAPLVSYWVIIVPLLFLAALGLWGGPRERATSEDKVERVRCCCIPPAGWGAANQQSNRKPWLYLPRELVAS